MNRETLRQYRSLLRERDDLSDKIEKLNKKIDRLPDIIDKVEASENEYPYIRIHIPVKAKPPREVYQLKKLIRQHEKNKRRIIETLVAIEEYIEGIEDSEDRQIFRMVYIDGMPYREVGDQLHMDLSNVAKRIDKQLSKNSKI